MGTLKGVILSICPKTQLVDLFHEVPPQAVATGAFLLKSAIGYFPRGTVHLAIVDPGVGSGRKAIAMKSHGHYFVGPDNGILSAALDEWGIEQAVELIEKKFWLPNVNSTFHGRDILAPIAAYLAKGIHFSNWERRLPVGSSGNPQAPENPLWLSRRSFMGGPFRQFDYQL